MTANLVVGTKLGKNEKRNNWEKTENKMLKRGQGRTIRHHSVGSLTEASINPATKNRAPFGNTERVEMKMKHLRLEVQ